MQLLQCCVCVRLCLCVNEAEWVHIVVRGLCMYWSSQLTDWEWMSSLCCASNLLCLACPPVDWGAHTHTHAYTGMGCVYALTPRGFLLCPRRAPLSGCWWSCSLSLSLWLDKIANAQLTLWWKHNNRWGHLLLSSDESARWCRLQGWRGNKSKLVRCFHCVSS